MTLQELMQTLSLPEETAAALRKLSLPAQLPPFREFLRDPRCLQPYAGLEDGLVLLKLYLQWAEETRTRYDALGIPEAVFGDGLRDLGIWARDYQSRHRRPGFAEWEWVANTLRLKVFRLGRLQFEPSVLEADIPGYPAGTPVLEVHIPAEEPLDPDAVAASLEAAPRFFETCFHRQFSLFRCHSWLLSPQLKELLPENARIIRFQNLFTVYAQDPERQAEERVFGFLAEDPADYPENTALQRSLKEALLAGTSVNMGLGIRTIP